MSYYIAKMCFNWDDEFDCTGFEVWEGSDHYYRKVVEQLDSELASGKKCTVFFGTNECITFSKHNQFHNGVTIEEINEQTYSALCVAGLKSFGVCFNPLDLLARLEEDDRK